MITKLEELSEKLHTWYLEATAKLNPNSYNQDAQKRYAELTDEQKYIDRYIAEKVLEATTIAREEALKEAERMNIALNLIASKGTSRMHSTGWENE